MKRINLIALFVSGLIFGLTAQNPGDAANAGTPKDHAWEIGLHGGHFFSAGNVDFIPGYAGGIHIRRSLDYVFSLRADFLYGSANGEDEGNIRSFSNTWYSGSLQAIAVLNNLKWDLGERKNNIYVLAGVGINSFEVDLERNSEPVPENKVESDIAGHAEIGAGVSFKINNKVNIGLEHKAMAVFGSRGDLVDAVPTLGMNEDDRTTFRDVVNYTSVRINFNIGKADQKTEPLYWLNPLDAVIADINKLKDTRVTFSDSDGDGVIDMLDEEEDTPAGAVVNAKGFAQDSDGDGVQDHEDKEPYSSGQYPTDSEGVSQVPDIMADVEKLVDEKLKDFQPKTTAPAPVASAGVWYMPAVYFDADSDKIKPKELGTLVNIAEVMKNNLSMKFVVIGHADLSGSEDYNNKLSYRRAKAVTDYLSNELGVSRSNLILNWKGEAANLTSDRDEVNRRVEFRVATNESEQAPPE